MTTPRIPPGSLRTLGPVNWTLSRIAATATRTEDMHLFSTFGRSRGLFRAWLYFACRIMPFGKLSRRDTEMIILRVAHMRSSVYEFEHHTRIGARVGIDKATLARIVEGPEAGWGDRERTLLRATDELVNTRNLSDEVWSALSRHLDEARQVSFLMLVCQYDALATFIETARIQPDTRIRRR